MICSAFALAFGFFTFLFKGGRARNGLPKNSSIVHPNVYLHTYTESWICTVISSFRLNFCTGLYIFLKQISLCIWIVYNLLFMYTVLTHIIHILAARPGHGAMVYVWGKHVCAGLLYISYTMYATGYIYTYCRYYTCTLHTWILYILKFYFQPFFKVFVTQNMYINTCMSKGTRKLRICKIDYIMIICI